MKNNTTLDYINKHYTGGYTNALTYVNSVSPVIVEEPSEEPVVEPDYLCFTATGESTIGIQNEGGNAPVLFYSTDKKNWVSWDYSTITLNDGESVYFYGENPDGISKSDYVCSNFTMTGSIASSGNIQTLLSQKGDRKDVTENCYYFMFFGCDCLISAPALPATTLAMKCYNGMFQNCYALTEAPALPATTLSDSCYYRMFYGCSSLSVAPKLPAKTLANSCYFQMFMECSSLTEAPSLPATDLTNYCYGQMFRNCASLTTAPVLPATDIKYSIQCYKEMFRYCYSLTSVTTYCVNWDTSRTGDWLLDAGINAENKTVYCPADSTIPSDNDSGIPSNWTRADI